MIVFRNLLRIVAAGAVALMIAKPAAAGTITYDITVGGSAFSSFFGAVPPASFVLSRLNVTLDPTANAAGAASLDFIDPIAFSGPLSFTYSAAADFLIVGGSIGGTALLATGFDDFLLTIESLTSGSPFLSTFAYTQAGIAGDVFAASARHVHVDATSVATTPLPAALPLFLAALGGLGVAGWRRRSRQAA